MGKWGNRFAMAALNANRTNTLCYFTFRAPLAFLPIYCRYESDAVKPIKLMRVVIIFPYTYIYIYIYIYI
jgi:hypothetical protein